MDRAGICGTVDWWKVAPPYFSASKVGKSLAFGYQYGSNSQDLWMSFC
jgi:hypothetical protein